MNKQLYKAICGFFYLMGLSIFFQNSSFSQSLPDRISGSVKDMTTGEVLPGANVYWSNALDKGVTTDADGTFSIRPIDLPAELTISYLGYTSTLRVITEKELGKENKFFLNPEAQFLEEFVVNEARENSNVMSLDIGKSNLPVEVLKNIPALFGEVDLLRGIQLLPGVTTAGEGTTGLFVRGGSADQNLIQIDGAPIFNPSHFFGFFSVFNPDALSNVELYKGHIPARYGGRLSSLIDISLKEGNTKRIHGEGGIGSISSRLTVDGPLLSDQSSFIVSGRRTYADIFLGLSPDENIRNNQLYFYDLSGKLMFRIKDRDKITLSSYYGSDYLGTSGQFGLGWNNWISSLNWTRSIREDLFLDVKGYHSYYKYIIAFTDESIGFEWSNNFSESGIRGEINWIPNENLSLYAGAHSQLYHFAPINLNLAPESNLESINTNPKTGFLNNLFIDGNYDVSPVFSVEGGLRWNHYQQIGEGVNYLYENNDPANGAVADTVRFGFGENMKTYLGLEPRLAARYLLSESLSLKGAYNRNFQYIQIATNNSAGLPIDRWMPAGTYVSPIRSDQVSLGIFKNLSNNQFELSMEGYYKDFDQIIDLKQGAEILFTDNLETEILSGLGWAYGAEFMLRKNSGKTTGWLSYTWSRVFRQIEGINENQPFNPRFDRPHDVSLVVNHKVNKRLEFSGTFVYTSGVAVTFPVGSYEVDNQRVPLYGPRRNEDRFPAYHRMDLSVNLKNRDRGRWWKGSWNFSVYNVYNRKNPFSYQFADIYNNDFRVDPGPEDVITSSRPGVIMTYLFGILPSVTYNFEF
ncbi:MAG TPA: TonB-dependent receptor [Lunatimonas sp.]|nr:TonB-dependent receptor [Lunatimonas sp.]